MDFVLGAMIDTHFSQRGRHGRLITCVAHHPQDVGLGIDEDTAFIMDDKMGRVIGAGAVTVVDSSKVSFTNLPEIENGDNLSLFGIKLHVLSHGCQFDVQASSPKIKNGHAVGRLAKIETDNDAYSEGYRAKNGH
jgi:cyanophycinase